MNTIIGDLWDYHAQGKIVVVTTNGTLTKKNLAVMGKGIALETAKRFPRLPKLLGERILAEGNRVHLFAAYRIITFPVKVDWRDPAKLTLIERSARELHDLLDTIPQEKPVYMPKPGCGVGGLSWKDVEPIIEKTLGDDYAVVVDRS